MEYKVSWSIPPDQGNHVTKLSYRNDPGMYLIDNFGNHYSFTGLTGAALDGCTLEANSPNATAYGSFIFPKAQPGATAFTFHDDDTHYAITINLGVPVH
ncbi:MAG: hypothetical protein HY872_13395 [Chloroflexi bacterium]|nr:hypothetical protein [Chloroflexota bacterium]MBI5829766.1 hypothetical protein [Chloroflexota bacterium]